MRVNVHKLSDNPNTYETKLENIDTLPFKPHVGLCLALVASKGDRLGVTTSRVIKIEEDDLGYTVHTMNSIYRIDYRDDCEVCDGKEGGVPGNELVIDGVITCDYCHAKQWSRNLFP